MLLMYARTCIRLRLGEAHANLESLRIRSFAARRMQLGFVAFNILTGITTKLIRHLQPLESRKHSVRNVVVRVRRVARAHASYVHRFAKEAVSCTSSYMHTPAALTQSLRTSIAAQIALDSKK